MQVSEFVMGRLRTDYLLTDLPSDVYKQMADAQEAFMKGRSHRLKGRSDVIKKVTSQDISYNLPYARSVVYFYLAMVFKLSLHAVGIWALVLGDLQDRL